MGLELDQEERTYLLTVLHEMQKELIHEINHTDSGEYKERLRQRAGMNERLIQRLEAATVAA